VRNASRALALAAAALTFLGAPLRADRFEDAPASANANLATGEGRDYAARFAAKLDEKKLRAASPFS
jgi:hypothetical protein